MNYETDYLNLKSFLKVKVIIYLFKCAAEKIVQILPSPGGGGGATLIGLLKNWPVKNWPAYLGVTSNFPFLDSVNRPLRISTSLAGNNCSKSENNNSKNLKPLI